MKSRYDLGTRYEYFAGLEASRESVDLYELRDCSLD
jgi:hypothetical protein